MVDLRPPRRCFSVSETHKTSEVAAIQGGEREREREKERERDKRLEEEEKKGPVTRVEPPQGNGSLEITRPSVTRVPIYFEYGYNVVVGAG